MANRRMVSKNVVESDPFLDMPAESQALYTHLMLNTDDDGFIDNPGSIRRMTGFSEDSFKLLIAKGFLIGFPNGVVAITHWEMQNKIQPTRKVGTVHIDELDMLTIDKQGKYVFLNELSENCRQRADELPTNCQQMVDKLPTNVEQTETAADEENQAKQRSEANYQKIVDKEPTDCQHRVGKDRLSKDRTGEYITMFKNNVGHEKSSNHAYSDFTGIVEMYNEICQSFEHIDDSENYTEMHSNIFINCLHKGYTEKDYRIAFNKAESSKYLKGQVEGKTEPSELSWMLGKLDKIINGDYD